MKFFIALIGCIIAFVIYLYFQEPQISPVNPNIKQKEITKTGPLLNSNGQLEEIGWARSPIKIFNEEAIRYTPNILAKVRTKKWDFYYFTVSDQLVVGLTIADLGYTKNIGLQIYHLENSSFINVDSIIPLWNPFSLPARSDEFIGNISVSSDLINAQVQFIQASDDPASQGFHRAYFIISAPKHNIEGNFTFFLNKDDEQIVMCTPINKESTKFYYNVKTYNMRVKGSLKLNNTEFSLENALGARDWGRGVWDYFSYWIWMTGQGYLKKQQLFGINLGRGFENAERAEAYEDSIFIDGKIIKLNTVYFEIPEDPNKKWHFYTKTVEEKGSIGGEFNPEIFFQSNVDFILIRSNIRKFYGTYSGWVIIDDKKSKINFDNILGFAETHKAKW